MNVSWASDAVVNRIEGAVGMKASALIALRDPAGQLSKASFGHGGRHTLALLAPEVELPLVGRWIEAPQGPVLLAKPLVRTSEELSRFCFDDFSADDYLVDLLVARDEAAISLAEAAAATEALKKKNRELEASKRQLETANARLENEITERTLTETKLQRYSADLEARNEEIRQFVYTVSHDLRTPLVNLKGFSGELRFALNDFRLAACIP